MFLVSVLISGCGDTTNGSPELPTPENLYSNDSEIDMFVYEGTAFVNAEDVDWVTEQDLTAGELAGTIEETDEDGDFEDWDATVLRKGQKYTRRMMHRSCWQNVKEIRPVSEICGRVKKKGTT